jgi:hypothetical protein
VVSANAASMRIRVQLAKMTWQPVNRRQVRLGQVGGRWKDQVASMRSLSRAVRAGERAVFGPDPGQRQVARGGSGSAQRRHLGSRRLLGATLPRSTGTASPTEVREQPMKLALILRSGPLGLIPGPCPKSRDLVPRNPVTSAQQIRAFPCSLSPPLRESGQGDHWTQALGGSSLG